MTINIMQHSKNTCVSDSGSPFFCSEDEAEEAVGEVRLVC